MSFEQDWALLHYEILGRIYFNQKLPNKWMESRGPISWPARSAYVVPWQLFLRGCVRDKLFLERQSNISDVNTKVIPAAACITSNTLQKLYRNIKPRLKFETRRKENQFDSLLRNSELLNTSCHMNFTSLKLKFLFVKYEYIKLGLPFLIFGTSFTLENPIEVMLQTYEVVSQFCRT